MQAVDNRESRLRKAFVKIERDDGRVRGEDLIRLLTVRPVRWEREVRSPGISDQGIHEAQSRGGGGATGQNCS